MTADAALIINRGRLTATVRLDELEGGALSLEELYPELTARESA